MLELIAGVIVIGVWIVLQFVVRATSGWIHLVLAAGVLLVIRGIVISGSAARSGRSDTAPRR